MCVANFLEEQKVHKCMYIWPSIWVFLCQFYVAKMPLKSYKICSKIFEHGNDPPPLLNDVKKNCGFGNVGHPLERKGNEIKTHPKFKTERKV